MKHSLILILLLLLLTTPKAGSMTVPATVHEVLFDGTRAYAHLCSQCEFGPRPPGSENLSLCRQYLVEQLRSAGWYVFLQNFTYRGINCSNIIARHTPSSNVSYIIGAHYDTRPQADRDPIPENRGQPVLGANDGASGTAVILELATVLSAAMREHVEFVLFDAEDSGGINGWDWIVGSTYYVGCLTESRRAQIRAMILLDMVGDADLQLLRELDSTRSLQDAVWTIAHSMGYNTTFIDRLGQSIIDDHQPFLRVGIPALDVIQHAPFPPTWHTVSDTPDKCSSQSLECVGRVIEAFLLTYAGSDDVFTTSLQLSPITISALFIPLVLAIFFYYRHRPSLK